MEEISKLVVQLKINIMEPLYKDTPEIRTSPMTPATYIQKYP
jgi:hypothetical protein